ncbi:hypothetical protein [Pedobacter jeongneungensis]|uniref:hypothetical protein n=1 Tax=Pedobacter jeongneungensis TaxID=947309 RepID=UPI00046ADEDA|nr:hypothetical protein [Pedobacter jeongneungensis]
MENEQEKTPQENTGNHPKPTDDVQLDIETVTPSTEKEVKDEDHVEENKNEDAKADVDGKEDKGENNQDEIETITPAP